MQPDQSVVLGPHPEAEVRLLVVQHNDLVAALHNPHIRLDGHCHNHHLEAVDHRIRPEVDRHNHHAVGHRTHPEVDHRSREEDRHNHPRGGSNLRSKQEEDNDA